MSSKKITESVNMLNESSVGSRLRAEREALGINQIEMARLVGVESAAAVSRYEKGQVPSAQILVRYATIFKVKVDDLLAGLTGGRGDRYMVAEPLKPYGSRAARLLRRMEAFLSGDDPRRVEFLEARLREAEKFFPAPDMQQSTDTNSQGRDATGVRTYAVEAVLDSLSEAIAESKSAGEGLGKGRIHSRAKAQRAKKA